MNKFVLSRTTTYYLARARVTDFQTRTSPGRIREDITMTSLRLVSIPNDSNFRWTEKWLKHRIVHSILQQKGTRTQNALFVWCPYSFLNIFITTHQHPSGTWPSRDQVSLPARCSEIWLYIRRWFQIFVCQPYTVSPMSLDVISIRPTTCALGELAALRNHLRKADVVQPLAYSLTGSNFVLRD